MCCVSCQDEVPTTLIPRSVLFGNPEKTSPKISPDGKRIAYLAPVDGVLNVWVKTIGADDDDAVTHDTDRGIRRYFWAESGEYILYLQDKGGNENWRLYGVHLDEGTVIDYTPFDGVQARIVEHLKQFPHEMLIALNKDNPRIHDVYHLDLRSGALKRVAQNPGNVRWWLADSQLKIRGAFITAEGGCTEFLVRENESAPFKSAVSWEMEDSNSAPLSFTKDGKAAYLLDSRNSNTLQLVEMEIASGTVKVLAADPHYDVRNVIIHPDTYQVQAVTFLKERLSWYVLDQNIKDDIIVLSRQREGDFTIVSRDNLDETWIIGYIHDDGPVSFYSYSRREKELTFLFDHKPDLNDYALASMQPVSFVARDGLRIHGYLTLPAYTQPAEKMIPAVLYVHGGPWARDAWGYDSVAQWLANRGYAVLQVNYRGSSGYGKDFLNAGNREWGGKMHDDLIDAVHWLIAEDIADPARVAIFGGSYGGYAALVGAAFTPDVFRCAVSIVGPSNLVTFIQSVPAYWSTYLEILYQRVGDPRTEKDFLKSRSPLFRAEAIRVPLLIAQGANDPRVKKAESDQIVAALKANAVEHEYVVFDDEGHGFQKPENRLAFYAVAEAFLARHLGGRFEAK